MPALSVQRNEVTYTGLYVQPPFALWGEGAKILEGLYGAFASSGVTLADIRSESGGGSVADEAVRVNFGGQASFRFKFDRIEASLGSFTDSDLDGFASLLSLGDGWLRSAAPDLRFSSHLVSYSAHCALADTTSTTFLSRIPTPNLAAFGQGRGNGVIWHGESGSTRLQLLLDHSILVQGGLFIQFIMIYLEDRVSFLEMLAVAREKLSSVLEELGLQLSPPPGQI